MIQFPTANSNLSMNLLATVFGGSTTNLNISNYYRGGPYVKNIPQNSNIPTSGTLIFPTHFLGAARNWADDTSPASQTSHSVGGSAQAGYTFSSNGGIYSYHGTYIGRWLQQTGDGQGSGFYIKAITVSSNASLVDSDSTDTWLEMSQSRSFKTYRSIGGANRFQFVFAFSDGSKEIFRTGTKEIVASWESSGGGNED